MEKPIVKNKVINEAQEAYNFVKENINNIIYKADTYLTDSEKEDFNDDNDRLLLYGLIKGELKFSYIEETIHIKKSYFLLRNIDYFLISNINICEESYENISSEKKLANSTKKGRLLIKILNNHMNIKSDDIANIITDYMEDIKVLFNIYGNDYLLYSHKYKTGDDINIMIPMVCSNFMNIEIVTSVSSRICIKKIILDNKYLMKSIRDRIVIPEMNCLCEHGILKVIK